MDLHKSWDAFCNLFSNEPSRTRNYLVNLTESFLEATRQYPYPILKKNTSAEDNKEYAFYAVTKDTALLGVQHWFLRFTDGNGKIICDLHGLKNSMEDSTPLEGIVEPKEFELFSKMDEGKNILLWKGGAQEAAEKLQTAFSLLERVNESHNPYYFLSQCCNTLFHSLLNVTGLQVPEDRPGWSPGLGYILEDDVTAVKLSEQPEIKDPSIWFDALQEKLDMQRALITDWVNTRKQQAQPIPAVA